MEAKRKDSVSTSRLMREAARNIFKKIFHSIFPIAVVLGMALVMARYQSSFEERKIREITNGGVVLYTAPGHDASDRARAFLQSQGVAYREVMFDGRPTPLINPGKACIDCFPFLLVDDIRINGYRPKAFGAALEARQSNSVLKLHFAQLYALFEGIGL